MFWRISHCGLRRGRDVPLTYHEMDGCYVQNPVRNFGRWQFAVQRGPDGRRVDGRREERLIFIIFSFNLLFIFFNFLFFDSRSSDRACFNFGCCLAPTKMARRQIHVPPVRFPSIEQAPNVNK